MVFHNSKKKDKRVIIGIHYINTRFDFVDLSAGSRRERERAGKPAARKRIREA